MKYITFCVPSYNAAEYMRHCIDTLLTGGEDVKIIIVDDGSTKDNTGEIADEYASKYPTIVKAIHQENGGHVNLQRHIYNIARKRLKFN